MTLEACAPTRRWRPRLAHIGIQPEIVKSNTLQRTGKARDSVSNRNFGDRPHPLINYSFAYLEHLVPHTPKPVVYLMCTHLILTRKIVDDVVKYKRLFPF